ncbi:MAG: hypothetical protein MUQ41_10850 [Loktanella sp.]|nr:hypothetical protein [Loktanella sp.]MDO7706165.1 hypothetical protein [Loktanella sp.]
MTLRSALIVPLFVLSACSNTPSRELKSLSDVTLGDDLVALAVVEAVSDADGLPPQDAIVAEVSAPKSGFLGGLFGGPKADPPQQAAEPQVTSDILLPFGQIAPNCTVSKGEMGKLVDQNAGYAIYDTAPNGATLRTHYFTGFKDNCARQFSAATALMGDIGTHEVVRYLPSNSKHPYSAADNAYELIKASFCGTTRGRPCGRKLDRLARNTTFITTYESFSDNADWADILLSNGAVVAIGPVAR